MLSMAQVSKDEGLEARNVAYSSRAPAGAAGASDVWTLSPTDSVIGGIISAWNMRVVGSSANSAMAFLISSGVTAGNSSTYLIVNILLNYKVRKKDLVTYTTVNEESLEAPYTLLDESLELASITRDDAAIETDIHPALALSSLDLFVQSTDSSGRWDGIEWHINDCSDTTKGSGLSAGIEAFPFGTARLVQMNVGIN